jgi:amino acid transporter
MWDVIIWGIASPAASGMLYYSVSTATTYAGAVPWLSFFLGGLTLLPIALTLAYMLQIMPRSGGMYVAMSRLIDPTVSFVFSWLYVLGNGFTCGIMAWVATGVLASVLTLGGHAANMPSLVAGGIWMTGLVGRFSIALFSLVVFFLVTMYSLGAVKWLMRAIFVLPVIATAAFIIIPVVVGPSGSMAAFDATWGSGVAEKIISSATANGWTNPAFSGQNTLAMLLVVYWAFTGWESVTFAAGEVKTPKRSLFTGLIGGFIGTWILYILVAASVWYPFTSTGLISAYTYLWDKYPAVLSGILPATRPSVPLFAGSLLASTNVWAALILMTLTALWFFNTIPPVLVATSRLLFAQSFDRALPARFSDVSESRGVPYYGVLVAFVIGVITILFYATNTTLLLATADFTWLCIFFIFGMAAMILPYKRPDMFKLSPLQSKVFGIPVISVLGLLSTGIGLWLMLFPVLEMDFPTMLFLAVWVMIGLVIYMGMQARNAKRGIDVSKIYQEIPPE